MNKKSEWSSFGSALEAARRKPGLYEIRMGEVLLKVGIASNLQRRLRQHARSSQKRLKSLVGSKTGKRRLPSEVASKGSILAKHLYFDRSVTRNYDLRTEDGRRSFLENQCQVRFQETGTRDEAKRRERNLEATKKYRYVGRVIAR